MEAWGLKNCTQKEEWISNTVTAVVVPPNIDSTEIVKRAWSRYNLSLGLGLNKVAGKVFRIGHLGHLNEVRLSILSNHQFLINQNSNRSTNLNAVATSWVFGWSGDGTQGCWLPSCIGKWSRSCYYLSSAPDPSHSFQDLIHIPISPSFSPPLSMYNKLFVLSFLCFFIY